VKTKVDGKIVETGIFNPSITWIDKYSPMAVGLLKYYAKHGWDEAQNQNQNNVSRFNSYLTPHICLTGNVIPATRSHRVGQLMRVISPRCQSKRDL
jgi:hypothetical protein